MGIAIALAVSACDSNTGGPSPAPPTPVSTPSATPTAVVPSTVTVTIRPAKGPLSAREQQVMAAFTEFVTAQHRFYSHPWILDPIYLRSVLPKTPFAPVETDTIGLIGPVTIQVLTVDAPAASKAEVTYCTDDRSVRYLSRDGKADVPGPAGDHYRGTVAHENTEFEFTTTPAADGKIPTTPRWVAADGGLWAGAKECAVLASSPPASPPHQTTP
jgi:hypothetical protein